MVKFRNCELINIVPLQTIMFSFEDIRTIIAIEIKIIIFAHVCISHDYVEKNHNKRYSQRA